MREGFATQLDLGLLSVDDKDGSVRSLGKGPSAGQSSMVLLFDLFLGVAECHGAEATSFQHEMIGYTFQCPRCLSLSYKCVKCECRGSSVYFG